MQQQQIHAEGSVRHAEKRRRGTCQFANRIARASLDAYERSVPRSYREANKQTCVAAIVAHFHHNIQSGSADNGDSNDEVGCSSNNSHLQVMGLGVGTKFLPDAIIREEQCEDNMHGYGKRLRDCHAEVLARRAFRRQIMLEILSHHRQRGQESITGQELYPILERLEEPSEIGGNNSNNGVDDDKYNTPTAGVCYRLKPGVTLHFYASSAPCKF